MIHKTKEVNSRKAGVRAILARAVRLLVIRICPCHTLEEVAMNQGRVVMKDEGMLQVEMQMSMMKMTICIA
jgi:hypothetical protein